MIFLAYSLVVLSDVYSSSEKSMKSGLSLDVYLPTPTMDDTEEDKTQSSINSTPVSTPQKAITVPGFLSIESTGPDDDKSSVRYSDDFDRNFESTGEELHHLSTSSSESDQSAADLDHKSSNDSRTNQSVRSYQSKLSDVPPIQQKLNTGHSKQQPPARLHPGFAMPKPLVSTRSPVPLIGKRQASSKPSIQTQPSDEDCIPPVTPPIPKPRTQLQQTGSTLSTTSRPLDHFSSSEFGTNYSGKDYGTGSEKDKSDGDYSDEFDTSDSSSH